MKSLGTAMSNLIAQQLGNEPVNLIEIQWVEDGQWAVYGDKDITNYEFPISGIIQELGELESVVKLDSQGQTISINIILSDHTGLMKSIIDNNDIHGRPVRIYQWFETLPLSEKFMLYEGQITSPITWGEGDRTLNFSAITQLSDKEVGFSPEEGNFPYLPDEMVGKDWPLIFGKVQNVPIVRLFSVPTTTSTNDIGVVDPSIEEQLTKLREQRLVLLDQITLYAYAALQAEFTCNHGVVGVFPDYLTASDISNACSQADQLLDMVGNLATQVNQLDAEVETLNGQRDEQETDAGTELNVVNGSNFPQGQSVTLQVGGVQLKGTFSGNTFTIANRININYDYEDGDDPFGYTFVQAGSVVAIKSDSPLVYIVSITSCTVHSVQAYKRTENEDVLTIVPTNWYTVKTTTVGVYTITYLEVDLPISSRDDTLQDDLYVTCTSNIGPNTVTIMEWLIDTYTDLSYDTATFNSVKTKLENYPSHFALLKRINILTILEEIAFQARCAIWINQRTFYLKYLPLEETESDTITESDIDAGTLKVFSSTTEELATKLVANWTNDYASTDSHKIILRHNIKKYGTLEREIDFYIYNIGDLVLKSATFWLIRLSNIWKNIEFVTYLHKLTIETFDIIKFDFNQTYIADADVKGMVTSTLYDSSDGLLRVKAWLPIKFGAMEKYDFTWPSGISQDTKFPTSIEITKAYAGGDGPGSDIEDTFILDEDEKEELEYRSIQYYRDSGDRDQRLDYGDEEPSDIGDVKPEPSFTGTKVTANPETEREYEYNNYGTAYILPVSSSEDDFKNYPGMVGTKVDDTNDTYNVTIYTEGLSEEGTLVRVKQLQIHEDAVIPPDTWTVVFANKLGTDEDGNDIIEYTMQVPVWL